MARLMERLSPQLTEQPVELLVNKDTGAKSIGQKRNELLERSIGRYVAFVDDDDLVSETYVKDILTSLQAHPNATHAELKGVYTKDGQCPRLFHHSIQYSGWYTAPTGLLCRYPNHLNPIRRDIAQKIGFPYVSFGEDRDFSQRLMEAKVLTTEAPIENILYHYEYVSKPARR